MCVCVNHITLVVCGCDVGHFVVIRAPELRSLSVLQVLQKEPYGVLMLSKGDRWDYFTRYSSSFGF